MNNWIVYWHKRKTDNIIFYVGIGKRSKRPNSFSDRNNWWHNEVNKHGFISETISENLSIEKACSLEEFLINSIGRRDLNKGPLLNLTDGGKACKNLSDESKKKMSIAKKGKDSFMKGKKHSLESKLKMSIAKQGKTYSEEYKRNMSLIVKKSLSNISPEIKEKMSLHKGKSKSEETKRKMSKAKLGSKLSEDKKKFILIKK